MQTEETKHRLVDRWYFMGVLFPVENVQTAGGYVLHGVTLAEKLRLGDRVQLFVDEGALTLTQLQAIEQTIKDVIH
ncbi:hypothetical protein EOD39_9330 [Acipenser ruthenus]|uniref:Uncharacterized protein n=1 Tax=Acipenser ruthenus TaxID=7906 RepID=A0A662YV50_ACIRT|nr:hypothetical protein EOD39_9330 [Acipenser ruthenus]